MEKAQDKLEFSIAGMHCAACSSRIENVVSKLDGVKKITVSLATGTATLALPKLLPEGVELENLRKEVMEKISSLGFEATPFDASDSSGSLESSAARWRARREQQKAELRSRWYELILAFCFALPLITLSMGEMLGMPLPSFLDPHHAPLNFALLQLCLCLPVIFIGRRFYTSGLPALARGGPNMDSLVALGTGAAFIYSLWSTVEVAMAVLGVLPHEVAMLRVMDLYYESAAMIIALISLGKYMELFSSSRTSEAIKLLLDLSPEDAILLLDGSLEGKQKRVTVADVKVGAILMVRPGDRIPVDGVVVAGVSAVDESMLTGESMPVEKGPGAFLAGGSINRQGALAMRAERVGADTVLARIVRLVQEAQGSKAPIAALADLISLYFVPVVMAIAVLSGIGWYLYTADFSFSLRIFVSVMVIACPCAMGLATPTSIMVGTGRGAQLGCLIKSGEALEKAAGLDVMVMDKTGTLTRGKPVVTDIVVLDFAKNPLFPDLRTSGLPEIFSDENYLLHLAVSLEAVSEHPLAQAMLEESAKRHINPWATSKFEAIPGRGIRGDVMAPEGTFRVSLGSLAMIREEVAAKMARFDAEIKDSSTKNKAHQQMGEVLDKLNSLTTQGKTPIILIYEAIPLAILAVADVIRPESSEVVGALKSMGLKVIMLSGDNKKTAMAIADGLGLDEVRAELLPDEKQEAIVAMQQQGLRVGMVGDGLNDAPAMAKADVGFAMSNGIDVTAEAGDIVLMREGLIPLLTAMALSKATMRNIKENLFWAFGYNILGIPVAAGLLHIWGGPTLSPMIAGAAMALSSVSVVSNALRLRFFKG